MYCFAYNLADDDHGKDCYCTVINVNGNNLVVLEDIPNFDIAQVMAEITNKVFDIRDAYYKKHPLRKMY